jgi:hypothetical protein
LCEESTGPDSNLEKKAAAIAYQRRHEFVGQGRRQQNGNASRAQDEAKADKAFLVKILEEVPPPLATATTSKQNTICEDPEQIVAN